MWWTEIEKVCLSDVCVNAGKESGVCSGGVDGGDDGGDDGVGDGGACSGGDGGVYSGGGGDGEGGVCENSCGNSGKGSRNNDGEPTTSSPTPSCGSSDGGGGVPLQPGTSREAMGADTQGGEEEESDLQLAWEVLELARIICQRCTVAVMSAQKSYDLYSMLSLPLSFTHTHIQGVCY